MRPHLLELEAFMAFPAAVRLDLDELAQSGLVLLCGDTGGGKTSLLDAIGYALYGQVPGERGKALDDLRSHHAPADRRARVRLEFSARGRRLRVTRTPPQLRPRSRGTGTVREQPTALLEERVGEAWTTVTQRLDDVGLEVRELLGMDPAQFFQVVVLPQGRFAAFLQAEHAERERLLKRLFHVDRFERAAAALGERAGEAERRRDRARDELHAVACRVAQQAQVDVPESPENAPAWAGGLADAAERERCGLVARVRGLSADRAAAEQERVRVEQLAARQRARHAAEAELAALESRTAEVDGLRAEWDAARRAAPVVLAARTAAEREGRADQARREEAEARRLLGALGLPADQDTVALRVRAGALHAESGRLHELAGVLDDARSADRAGAAATARAERERTAGDAVRRRLEAELPAERQRAAAALDRARAAEREVPGARAEFERRSERARLAVELAELDGVRAGVAEQAEQARVAARTARDDLAELREQRIDAIRYELAATLVDGDPCPVCGALDHPEIAEVRADHVSRDAEREAQRAADRAAAAAEAARDELVRSDARLAGLRDRLAGVPDDGPVEDAMARLAALTAAAEGLPDAERAVDALQQEAERLATRLASLLAEVGHADREAEDARERAAGLRRRVAEAVGADTDVPARRAEVVALVAAVERAAEAAGISTTAQQAAADAAAACAQLAAAAGSSGVDEALRSARDEAWLADADRRLEEHERALAGVRARLAGVELAVPLDPPAAVDLARERCLVVVAEHEEALAAERVAAERAEQLAKLVPGYEVACDALPALRQAAGELRGLADLVTGRGGNRLSMPLSTFVLAARLEEVAQAASLRLSRMSGGRYVLVHTDAGRDKRSRAGLGLQVEDGWTGRRRDTATLSGGETFMTALALALGLADVVTAEAGGRSIDALFVDEGFGTLDADSLDQVMDVLDDLRSGGRLVGVVSHVADLRQRIPAQVRVLKGTTGSEVDAVTGGPP